MLKPIFDNIPDVLKNRPRWVLWRLDKKHAKKIPIGMDGKPVDIRQSTTQLTFEAACAAYKSRKNIDGIGLILNGDGLVGVDLDDCVTDGRIHPSAIECVQRLGSGYVELSPSGTGLHVYGYADEIIDGTRGLLGSLHVELYAQSRYLTVTGHVQQVGCGNVSLMPGFQDLCEQLRSPKVSQEHHEIHELQELQDFQDSHELKESQARCTTGVAPCCPAIDWECLPTKAEPTGYGERNKAIFEFARYLRGHFKGAEASAMYELVWEWHQRYGHKTKSKDFDETWIDFEYGWDRVQTPYGEHLAAILSRPVELPKTMTPHQYGDLGNQVLKICMKLGAHHAPKPFPLAGNTLAGLIDTNQPRCNKLLSLFLKSGHLKLVQKGHTGFASTYFLGDSLVQTAKEQP